MICETAEPWTPMPLPDTPCEPWSGSLSKKTGHGNSVQRNGVRRPPHVWAYLDGGGHIPPGWHVDHLCNNPPCVRFGHLEAVTPAENMRRMGYRKTECANGHQRNSENSYVWNREDGRTWVQCRPCKAAAQLRYIRRR